jgi:hypothetical protein
VARTKKQASAGVTGRTRTREGYLSRGLSRALSQYGFAGIAGFFADAGGAGQRPPAGWGSIHAGLASGRSFTLTVPGAAEGTATGAGALAEGAVELTMSAGGGVGEGTGLADGVTPRVDWGARTGGARIVIHAATPRPPTTRANPMPAAAASA